MTKIHLQLLLALPLLLDLVRGARLSAEQNLSGTSEGDAELVDEGLRLVYGRPHMVYRPPPPDTRRRRSAEDERKKREKHRLAHQQDCEFTEEWGPWSDCSATCGGGIRTAILLSRNITKQQDVFKYGKKCPEDTRRFEACAQDVLCATDCSTVDLNNRLPAVGGAAQWKFEAESGQCVFQFWQVIPGGPTPRVRFLGQTKEGADLGTADGAVVYDAGAPAKRFVLQLENTDLVYGDVAVGFRGCTLKPTGDATSVAKVCIWGGEAFRPETQTAALDKDQQARLAALRTASRAGSAGDLAKRATRKEGVGAGEQGVTFEGTGTSPGFAVQVNMAPQRPDAPAKGNVSEAGDDVLVEVRLPRDNGAKIDPGFKVSLKRQFLQRNNDACKPVPVQPCGSGPGPTEPCFVDAPANAGPGVVLRNLVFASKYEVHVAVQNAAGWGDSMAVTVMTRAKPGVSIKECLVDYWSCSSYGNEATEDHFPSPGDPECSPSALPLPVCRQKGKEGKCDGKKYLHQCKPIMKVGEPTCVGNLEAVCVHRAPVEEGKPAPAKCAAAGCSRAWLYWNQKHCCCRSKEDTAEDSPNCGCTTEPCSKLGWVDAVNPGSCRH